MERVSRWKWKLRQNTLQQSKVCGICLKERIEKNPVSTSSKTKGSFSVCSSPSHLSAFILESLNYASMNKFVHFSSPTLVRNRMFWYGLKSISYKYEMNGSINQNILPVFQITTMKINGIHIKSKWGYEIID